MTAESTMDGERTAGLGNPSAAEKLRQKHEAEAAHNPTVEEVIDEEDLAHPPPSLNAPQDTLPAQELAVNGMSLKAMGKQKVDENVAPTKARPETPATIDTRSEELFPALGTGPKPSAPSKPSAAWGVRKPASVQSKPNGVKGNLQTPSMTSSRASTPTSGVLTPISSNAPLRPSSRGGLPQQIQIPGQHSERIQFAPSQLLPRNQLKKPLQDTLREINKRSKAKIDMKTGFNGNVVFEGRGPVDATRQALKDLAREVGSKQQVKVPLPLPVRPHVIGRQGATIQNIEKRTGAKLQLPRNEESHASIDEDDDSRTIDVLIEGDAVAAEMARQEIESIINERTSTVNLRLKHIPPEYFPFIAGPHSSNIRALEDGREVQIQVPHYTNWSDRPPPATSAPGLPPQFVPSSNHHIRISGDRLAAQQARAEIERQVEDLRQQISLTQMQIDRGRHQFILENENSLHDFLNETGCAVILPPATDDSEMLTITGPQDKLDFGTEKAMDLASAMQMSRIDVARQHTNAPLGAHAHARAVTRYLQQRQALQQLEQQYNARIVLPSDDRGSADWEIYVKEGKSGMRAKQDILGLISAHPPARIRHVQLDPFFHHHVHRQTAQRLRNEYGVVILPPRAAEPSENLILVYEGPQANISQPEALPRHVPLPQEVAEFEQNLEQAQQYILRLIGDQQGIDTATVAAPRKYHDKVRKFVHREQEHLPALEVPVQVEFGSPETPDRGMAGISENGLPPPIDHQAMLKGPKSAIEALAAKVEAFIEAEKRDELERGHVTSFDYPQKHMSHLIGKRGENISKLRDEFDVDIQTKEGKVDVIGPKAKAEQLRARIIAQAKQLEDERSHVLKIPSKYHRDIIGAKGSQVNHLQERYGVRVHFPRSAPAPGNDRPTADDASEISAPRNRKPNQGPDEVIVKGPSKGADSARDELLSLLQWTMDNSHTSKVRVAQKQLPSLIGQGGQEMEALRLASGAQVDVPSKDSADSGGRVDIQLKGTKKQVEEARRMLEQKAKVFDNTVTRSIEIDRKHHRALIGSGGSNIRNIVVAAGGSDDRRDLARTVRFPKQDSETDTIHVEGDAALVEKIVAAIQSVATEKEGQQTVAVDVPPEKHRLLIGAGGETRRRLEAQFKVELNIPKLSEEGPARSKVKITGQAPDIERAQAHILGMIEDHPGETIQIPRRHHHTISDNGRFFRHLRNDFHVTVDHGSQRPPAKTAPASASQNANAAMPLITDDPSSHSFNIVNNDSTSAEEGEIPWILKGTPENVAKARSALDRSLKAAETRESQLTGYLVLPDPSLYRYVIGKGGSKINDIRAQTGCKITVPRQESDGNAIQIVGSRDGVEQAKDIILEAVDRTGGY